MPAAPSDLDTIQKVSNGCTFYLAFRSWCHPIAWHAESRYFAGRGRKKYGTRAGPTFQLNVFNRAAVTRARLSRRKKPLKASPVAQAFDSAPRLVRRKARSKASLRRVPRLPRQTPLCNEDSSTMRACSEQIRRQGCDLGYRAGFGGIIVDRMQCRVTGIPGGERATGAI